MAKINSKNNDFLNEAKKYSNQKVYTLILRLFNEDKEDQAEDVYRVDYLLRYATICAKGKDFDEAMESLNSVRLRMKKLESNDVDVEHLNYLIDILLKNYPKLNRK